MTSDPSLREVIEDIVDDKINQMPSPEKCEITKIHDDNTHVDVKLDRTEDELSYLLAIGDNLTVGHTGIIIYLNGGFDECIVITK